MGLITLHSFERRDQGAKSDLRSQQWRRLPMARGYVPPVLQMAGHGITVSRRTANKRRVSPTPLSNSFRRHFLLVLCPPVTHDCV